MPDDLLNNIDNNINVYIPDSDVGTLPPVPVTDQDEFIGSEEIISDFNYIPDSDGYYVYSNDTDYTTLLGTIIQNQEILIDKSSQMSDNLYRLYYFIGGLYIAFAILIGIKFFKSFFF